MSMWRTPRWLSASTTAFCTAGVDPTVADSPMPLAPSGLSGDGVSVCAASNDGNSAALGMRVVGERRRERVAVVVVDHLLPQRLRDARREPAVHLAVDEHRVEDAAAVVDRDVADRRRPGRSRCRPRRPTTCAPNGNVAPDCAKSCSTTSGIAVVGGLASRAPPTSSALRRHAGDAERPSSSTHDVVGRGLEQLGREACGPARARRCDASSTALPPSCSEREPPVPPPRGTSAVSDCTKRICSIGMPSSVGDDHARTRWRGPGRAPTCPPYRRACRRRAPRPRRTRCRRRPR